MLKRKFYLVLIGIMFTANFVLIAQQLNPTVSFESETHDFGIIKEADGPTSFQFVFTNIGGAPLILKNVIASCGCTTPNWSKDPVLPGAKGFINVSYNPSGRPGKFEKQITVTSNADIETQLLFIKGEVIPRQLSMDEQYPNNIEGFRIKSYEINFGSVSPDKKASQTIEGYNSTDQLLKVNFIGVPKNIKIKIEPEKIKPKEKAVIQIEYEAPKDTWGIVRDYITVNINNKDSKFDKKIPIHAFVKDDFSQLTAEQKKNAPKIVFENLNFNFGNIKAGDKPEHEFVFKNEGKSDLIIRKLNPSCGCTVANLKSNIIKPGESSTISIMFNSIGRKKGHESKQVSVLSNDPVSTELVLKIFVDIQ
jgi:hypothetical protein